ncbi:NUDIX hydrolase [Halorussus sp. MSC15.2]|uniref:NUDIX hydrolase n=1 Tax=Halorussus sp. MSC15.2 TaxID=2283638 RepID=UPI0013D191EA|nr:NUDIX hydrolase [Halorussus sp. MSC15.2]NEU56997.1 NUDIX hydrolase [Halorussus sp. MSC15.2]
MDELDRLSDRDDVATSAETIPLDSEAFEAVRENVEAGSDRWVGALVRDGDDRVALVRNRWSDGWVLPGGDVERGESLREAVVREVREETGLDAVVERPLEVSEQTFVADEFRGASEAEKSGVSGYFAVFEARSDDASLGDDLGRDDAEIADAAWFDSVPDECEHADILHRHC